MRRIIEQIALDAFWSQIDGGTSVAKAADLAGLHPATAHEIHRFNRRYGPGCDLERKAEVVAQFHALMRGCRGRPGLGLWDAARQVGLSFTDAMQERGNLLSALKERAESYTSLRPRHITAPEFSTEWYEQNNEAFVVAMHRAHPELFGELV